MIRNEDSRDYQSVDDKNDLDMSNIDDSREELKSDQSAAAKQNPFISKIRPYSEIS